MSADKYPRIFSRQMEAIVYIDKITNKSATVKYETRNKDINIYIDIHQA